MLLPLNPEPFTAPTDRDMLPSERREFVRTHRTCVFGYSRRNDGPALSVVYYVPTDDDELLVSTMAGRSKALAVSRDPKVSLCVLDERWPFTYLQVYADATVDADRELVVDVMMAVGERMSGQPSARTPAPSSRRWPSRNTRRAPLPAVLDVRATTSPPQPQRPGRTAHALDLGSVGWDAPDPPDVTPGGRGRGAGHSQPTRLKDQRSTTTVRAMMAIASG